MRERQRIDLGARLATYLLEGRTYSSGATVALPSSAYRDERRWAAERALLGGRAHRGGAVGPAPAPG
ncbi:MAG: hypothetical protein R2755_08205 [Acidimicrobiales bacterium]